MSADNDLVRQMADAYINCVRDLESRIRDLTTENADLRLMVQELREATDTYYEGETHNYV